MDELSLASPAVLAALTLLALAFYSICGLRRLVNARKWRTFGPAYFSFGAAIWFWSTMRFTSGVMACTCYALLMSQFLGLQEPALRLAEFITSTLPA